MDNKYHLLRRILHNCNYGNPRMLFDTMAEFEFDPRRLIAYLRLLMDAGLVIMVVAPTGGWLEQLALTPKGRQCLRDVEGVCYLNEADASSALGLRWMTLPLPNEDGLNPWGRRERTLHEIMAGSHRCSEEVEKELDTYARYRRGLTAAAACNDRPAAA